MLDFDEIENCFPERGALCAIGGRITVSNQWLHDFAHNVAAREREECAKIASGMVADLRHDSRDVHIASHETARKIADVIRKRSNGGLED